MTLVETCCCITKSLFSTTSQVERWSTRYKAPHVGLSSHYSIRQMNDCCPTRNVSQCCFLLSWLSVSQRRYKKKPKSKKYHSHFIFGAFRLVSYPPDFVFGSNSCWSSCRRSKTILISGATGCIGRQIWLQLMQHTNHRVKLIVRKDSLSKLDAAIWKKYSRRSQVWTADLEDIRGLSHRLGEIDCAILAATSWGGSSAFAVNVDATLQLVQWLPKHCHILYFSTASIIDKDGFLLEEAYRFGTLYLQSKYVALQKLLAWYPHRNITVLFPTLVVGPHSHLADVVDSLTSWKRLLEHIYLDASAHFIHATDAAKIVVHFVNWNPKPSFYTCHRSNPTQKLPALILGQPCFTAEQLIQLVVARPPNHKTSWIPRIPILSLFPPVLLSRILVWFGATVDPWVLYCLRKRHFVYPNAVAPEHFGLTSQWRHVSQLVHEDGSSS